MFIVARLELVLGYGFPGRQNMTWDVSRTLLHTASVLVYIGTNQMDVDQLG